LRLNQVIGGLENRHLNTYMFDAYLNLLSEVSFLSETSKTELLDHIKIKHVAKSDFLLKHGEVCKHIYYVNKGFVRIFYYKNGKNITEWFANEGHFCFSITSFFEGVPSKLVLEALEDSEIILLSKTGLERLKKTNIEIANLLIEFFSSSLILSQKRMESLQFETAKQRYSNLLKEQPSILNRVPLQYIATYLGITQETLSRIRSKV